MMPALRRMMGDTTPPPAPRRRPVRPEKRLDIYPLPAYVRDDDEAMETLKRRAANLLRLRLAAKMTQATIARRAKMQPGNYLTAEKGYTPITLRMVDALAVVYRMTPSALLAELDREPTC